MPTVPRHRPPFGLSLLLKNLTSLSCVTVETVESEYANALGVQHAVWIPSARFGIAHALQARTCSDDSVQCLAFNCGAVLHALAVSGRSVQFLDCCQRGLHPNVNPGNACVVSEVFGWRSPPANSTFTIYDMAMCLPTIEDMRRLKDQHAAVLSFGLGKPLAAGGGGLLLTNDGTLASAIRNRRQQAGRRAYSWKSDVKFVARTMAHSRFLYSLARGRNSGQHSGFSEDSPEWNRAAGSLSLKLSLENLAGLPRQIGLRRELAEEYEARLSQFAWVNLPPRRQSESHFSIRVPVEMRDGIQEDLRLSGVDTGQLFPLDSRFSSADLPNAARLQSEIINLPLHHDVKIRDLKQVVNVVARWDLQAAVVRKAA